MGATWEAFLQWREVPAPRRGEAIRRVADALRLHKDALGSLVSMESGKIKAEGDGEVQEMIDIADFAVGLSRMLYGLTMPSERPSHRLYEQWHPLGIVGIISAFNFPVAVWSWNAFIAAVCGNACVWKPSPKTPLASIAVQNICNEALADGGYPPIFSLFNTAEVKLAERFVDDPRVDLVSFTGSTAVGRQVAQRVAGRLGKYLLELGGNNAIVVDEHANLELAVPAILFGAVGTAGQRCTSTRRLLVHRLLVKELTAQLVGAYRQVPIGDPLKKGTLMGPLIDEAAVDRYLETIKELRKLGAKILHGGKRVKRPGYFVEPTIVDGRPRLAARAARNLRADTLCNPLQGRDRSDRAAERGAAGALVRHLHRPHAERGALSLRLGQRLRHREREHRHLRRRNRRRVRRREGNRRRPRGRLRLLEGLHAPPDGDDQLGPRPAARPGHRFRRLTTMRNRRNGRNGTRYQRREALPWHAPKSAEDDADAPARVQAILRSPGYVQADQDTDFLNRDEIRGVRLQIDYLKAELLLAQHDIRHTIVVFGSTRIPEPAAAQRRLATARAALAADPGNAALARRVTLAEKVAAKSHYYEIAREFGRLVGLGGGGPADSRVVIMTGGGPGIMEAANRGAHDVGAKSVGLNISLPHEQYPNPYVTPDLCFSFHYFAMRKLHFLKRACALVAFPGGYGTLDELFETLTLVQTGKISRVPVVLVGEDYWRRAFDIDFLVEEGAVDDEDRDLFRFTETAAGTWETILRWHREIGQPLYPPV